MIVRYVRFTVTKIRGAENVMQYSKLHLYLNNSRVLWDASATTFSSFDSFAFAGEKSLNIVKNTGVEKWCVTATTTPPPPIEVVIDNLSAINIDSYAYITANDNNNRDPVSWTFEASTNNLNWELVGSGLNETITTLRDTSTQLFPLLSSSNPSIYYASPLLLIAC